MNAPSILLKRRRRKPLFDDRPTLDAHTIAVDLLRCRRIVDDIGDALDGRVGAWTIDRVMRLSRSLQILAEDISELRASDPTISNEFPTVN